MCSETDLCSLTSKAGQHVILYWSAASSSLTQVKYNCSCTILYAVLCLLKYRVRNQYCVLLKLRLGCLLCVLPATPSLSVEENEGVQVEWGFISDDVHWTHSAAHTNPMSLQPFPHHGPGMKWNRERERTASVCGLWYRICYEPLTLTHTPIYNTRTHTCVHTPCSATSTQEVAMGQQLVGNLLLATVGPSMFEL